MMESQLRPPQFASDAEESEWWYAHRNQVNAEVEQAFAAGRVSRGVPGPTSNKNTPTTTIRLDPADIVKAKLVAKKKGLRYQTYIKMLLHEALERESVG